MLSVSKPFKGAGRADYYLNLAREDYYLDGNEPPGRWLGEGASAFDLPMMVAGDDFRNLLAGFRPDGSVALVHNAGSAHRRSGWDLTWSVPKSVSVAWSQASPEVRQVIEREVWASVCRAISYVEGIGIVSRRGTDGIIHEAAKVTFAGFLHSTSREQDPQLHIHTILLNVGIRPDGSTGTLDPRAVYRHQLAAGALFRAELAARLEQSLGLRARREGRCFEILGVDTGLMAEFSKRRAQIQKHLLELGLFGPEASEKAAFDTRASKVTLPRSVLFARWQDIGRAHHWSTPQLSLLLHAPFPARNRDQEIERTKQAALQALTQSDSHFSFRQLVQSLAQEAQGTGLNANDVVALQEQLLASPQVIPLQSYIYEPRWTTPEMLAMEKHVLKTADSMRQREQSRIEFKSLVNEVLKRHSHLSDEQQAALRHVVRSERGVRVVTGMAGTGKSSLFRAVHEIWTAQGRQVYGACLAGKAAQELTQAAGIPAQTLQRLLLDLKHRRIELDSRSILLVDEAGMVGTRQMKMLFDYALTSGASIVLCGDPRQLQSIEAGGVFRTLTERFDTPTLREIRRQREVWARRAVQDFADGRTAQALTHFISRGLLTVDVDAQVAMNRLLHDWKRDALRAPEQTIILASRNCDVLTLNQAAQKIRLHAGQLQGTPVLTGSQLLYIGDRIVFTRNCTELRVCNGELATIVEQQNKTVLARLNSGRSVLFAPSAYPHVQLAYAMTTHKAQGLTVERSFIYLDPTTQSREVAYVQASRARGLCSFYAAVESWEELVPPMMRSRPKVLATSLLNPPAKGPVLTLELAC